MHSATVDQVMTWGPCSRYRHARIKRLFRGRRTLGVASFAAMRIPVPDRLWAVGHLLTAKERRRVLVQALDRNQHERIEDTSEEELWYWAYYGADRACDILRAVRRLVGETKPAKKVSR